MFNSQSELITLKDDIWLKNQRHAGKCVGEVLNTVGDFINYKDGLTTKDIEKFALNIIKKYNCTPTFYNYKGFPGAICASVNETIVHGIPTQDVLQEGDKITVDLGATFNGAIADAARTFIYRQDPSPLNSMAIACEKALGCGIGAVKPCNRIGAIGNAIYKFSKTTEFNVIIKFGGHGLDLNKPHADPFISNRSNSNDGVMIQPGMTLAIEPILVPNDISTKILDDGWTVVTNGVGVHCEHTIFVHEDYTEIITK